MNFPKFVLLGVIGVSGSLPAQQVRLRQAAHLDMPAQVDSNSPSYWKGGEFHLLNSTGAGPVVSTGPDQLQLSGTHPLTLKVNNPWPTWFESAWVENENVVLAWYHQEHFGLCKGSNLSVPQIGAAISYDGGGTFFDLGAIITSPDGIDCSSQNGYFAGGQGDFSVILDRAHKYFYFLFSNYAGPLESQGVSIARMPFVYRYFPAGQVQKYYAGYWTEPGLGGHSTPIFPSKVSWQQANTNSFWGPAISWNTYLESYVMLLNHSCCSSGFPSAGISISFSNDLSHPETWTAPKQILRGGAWYPEIIGENANASDSLTSRVNRLYLYGHSDWELIFEKPATAVPPAQ